MARDHADAVEYQSVCLYHLVFTATLVAVTAFAV
jgi:hypothetical protein